MQHQNTKWRNMTTNGGALDNGMTRPLTHNRPYHPQLFDTTIVAGTRVSKIVQDHSCPSAYTHSASLAATAPCSQDLIFGRATGVTIKTLPMQYEILWDDGITSMEWALDLNVWNDTSVQFPEDNMYSPSNVDEKPIGVPPKYTKLKVVCDDKQYSILDMCIDQTVLLVAGGIALYLIVKK